MGTDPAGTTETLTRTLTTDTTTTPDGVPLERGRPLARPTGRHKGVTVDGVQCARLSQLAYQAFTHLQVFVRGRAVKVPGGIGLISPVAHHNGTTTTYAQSTCAYWLHTDASNGVIAVRSPRPGTYRLGQFFAVWGQPLSPTQLGPARGKVTAIVNGQRWRSTPRSIPLSEHTSIELAVGSPVPRFQAINWTGTGL
ncbi:MAG: hypothetical protein J2O48_13605 [Solirubrobacterales bacterium]|nr:hypothetical protein [Solirubrobacterales bacterium]